MNIDGHTHIYGLFGYPIKHTSSPAMHKAGFQELGINAVYLPFEVRSDDLNRAMNSLTALGIKGINLTIPHKQACLEFLDSLSSEAELIGAVNTIVIKDNKLSGHNTDGLGFIASLKEDLGLSPAGISMFILGAGGAAQAVAMQMAKEGAVRIIVADIIEERASHLADNIRNNFPGCFAVALSIRDPGLAEELKPAKLLINATPVGMNPDDPLPVPEDILRPDLAVYDLVYNLKATKLVEAARQTGARAVTGTGMLLYQGVRAFELWTEQNAPVEVMREALLRSIKT